MSLDSKVANLGQPLFRGVNSPSQAVALTRFTNHGGPLTKQFSLAADGSVEKTTSAQLTNGDAATIVIGSLAELAQLICELNPNQCLGFGTMERAFAGITTTRTLSNHPDKIARSRAYFRFSDGAAIMMIDHDALPGIADKSPEELRQALIAACPALAAVPMLWTASASSCISNESEDLLVAGLRGQRLYFLVRCGVDIPRAGAALYERLWLGGSGQYAVSRAGTMLDRNLIDGSVWQPERCDFAAGAICVAPLVQRRPAPQLLGPAESEGYLFNLSLIAELTEIEKSKVAMLREAVKSTMESERASVRAAWLDRRAVEIVEKTKIPEGAARTLLNHAVESMELHADFVLHAADGTAVSVAEILKNPAKWRDQRFADPLEPEYRSDTRIASLDLRPGAQPRIYSHAHGGQWFALLGERVPVTCEVGQLAQTVDACLAVIKTRHQLFDFGSHNIARVARAGRIYTVDIDYVSDHLSRVIDFRRYNARKERLESVSVPRDLARTIIARHGERPLPELLAVITAPTLRSDGSILSAPGYDAASKLFYRQSGLHSPHVPSAPDQSAVEKAFERLWRAFRLFPFASAPARGVMLAALLSATVRRSLPTCPAFALDAPAAGNGKTLLARCIAALSGADASTSPPPGDDEEMRKVLFSFLRTSGECLIIDNVENHIGGSAFNQFVTEPRFSGRILGQSEIQTLQNNCLLILTGNNLRIKGDACRRVLVARIDAVSDSPHLRSFEFCPLALCRNERLELVIDALTILRGYIAAGSPRMTSTGFASFEAWDALVRQAVCWVSTLDISVTLGDPVESIVTDREADPDHAAAASLLRCWKTALGAVYQSASSVVDLIRGSQECLITSIEVSIGKTLNPQSLGAWLRKHEGIVVDGLRFESRYNGTRKSLDWRVQDLGKSN